MAAVPATAARPRAIKRAQRTLKNCAEAANAELLEIQAANQEALSHAKLCGDALLEARAQVGHGEWLDWLAQNFLAEPQTGRVYMRIARRWGEVVESGAVSISQAERWLRDHAPKFEAQVEEAQVLRSEGLTQNEISRSLGVTQATVSNWLNPDAKRHKRNMAERRRDDQEVKRLIDRDEAMRKLGGEISAAYGLVRRTVRSLDIAIDTEQDKDVIEALATARQAAYRLEDEIANAARIKRPQLKDQLRSKRGD